MDALQEINARLDKIIEELQEITSLGDQLERLSLALEVLSEQLNEMDTDGQLTDIL